MVGRFAVSLEILSLKNLRKLAASSGRGRPEGRDRGCLRESRVLRVFHSRRELSL